jgi:hypothetical protein
VQQAAAQVAIEMPYEEAHTLFSDLTGVQLGSERLHTFVHQAAEELSVLEVCRPARRLRNVLKRWQQGAFAVPCWYWALMELMCPPVPTVRDSAKRDSVTAGPDAPHGTASGEMPRASDFISSMTSVLSMC